ncbi:hypothetical protein RF11_06235 [Thelohanellus kitauei]|uniref:Uncharacterized protein n=1 Tax=Thelohanellus kitauei TaxID=669202 RepID=A0A0C2J3P8_THEKT|nr:hypothetical protein RF11_06235 [Thelohanellus kitauei]
MVRFQKKGLSCMTVSISAAVTDIRAQMIDEAENLSLSKCEISTKRIWEEMDLRYVQTSSNSSRCILKVTEADVMKVVLLASKEDSHGNIYRYLNMRICRI